MAYCFGIFCRRAYLVAGDNIIMSMFTAHIVDNCQSKKFYLETTMVMMIILHDLSSFHYVVVLSRNKGEENLIVIVVRNTIIEKSPLPQSTPPHCRYTQLLRRISSAATVCGDG